LPQGWRGPSSLDISPVGMSFLYLLHFLHFPTLFLLFLEHTLLFFKLKYEKSFSPPFFFWKLSQSCQLSCCQ
jgi:hypothetical protein